MSKTSILLCFGAALIGAALLFIRSLSAQFYLGTTTADHPYALFVASLILAGLIWCALIPVLKSHTRLAAVSARNSNAPTPKALKFPKALALIIIAGLAMRGIFIGSTPIYEDDWNRYLWDGFVTSQSISPYLYSPQQIIEAPDDASGDPANSDLEKLSELSRSHNNFAGLINSPSLTTIYPPVAMAVFTLSAKIKALDLDVLRVIFILSEGLTLFLMSKALSAYGRAPIWIALYAFNPLVIYSGINAAHMDVLLLPFVMWALLAIKRRPFWAGIALSCAAAVKIWPLMLAPVLYRTWLSRPKIYIGSALLILVLSAALLAPMLVHLGGNSGASAYAQGWQRNSFLFPIIEQALSNVTENSGRIARIGIAVVTIAVSLWLGFSHLFSAQAHKGAHESLHEGPREQLQQNLPMALLCLILIFLLLSPTGFPWYAIWLIAFVPFAPLYGAAILTALLPLYYLRFALGEAGHYHIFTDYLIPLQFGAALIILAVEFIHARKTDPHKRPVDTHG